MRVFARRIELQRDVTVQRPHDADPRKHGRAVMFDDQERRFDRSLPLRELLFGVRKLLDIFGVLKRTSWRPRESGIGSSNARSSPDQPSRCGLIRGDAVEITR
jgi:hypothetical protein